jgi:hypothetical protein
MVRVPEMLAAELVDSTLYEEITKLRLEAIWAILKANSIAVTISDHFGQTPLHLALLGVLPSSCWPSVLKLPRFKM